MTERERFENWVQNETRLPFHAYWAAWLGWEARATQDTTLGTCDLENWPHKVSGDCANWKPAPTPAASQKGEL